MSNLAINSEQKYLLNGIQLNAPIEWEDVTIEADYVNDSVQPSLSIEAFTFALDSRNAIKQWITDGLSSGVGIFEGMPFQLTLFNNLPVQQNFKAFIDFTKDYQDFIDDGKVKSSIMKDNSLDSLFERVDSLTFGYLESIGVIKNSDYQDVDYIVEKNGNEIEILMLSVILFIMTKELVERIIRLIDNINLTVSAIIPCLPLPTSMIGMIAYSILLVLLEILYIALILVAIINLGTQLFEILIQPKRTHKSILLKTALAKVCNYLGYNLITPITELNNVYYLPSNPNLDEVGITGIISSPSGILKGIPNTLDYGYNCGEMFELAKKCFNAKISIIGNDVHLRSENDPFWIQQSTWTPPNILIKQIQYNTSDLKPTKIISFNTDLNDDYTVENFTGTNIEIHTNPNTIINQKAVLLKGLEEVKINCALGNRKNSLTNLETFLKEVGGFIDGITGIFGGGTNLAGKVNGKIGVLKVSNNWTALPKLLYLSGGKLPTNHRNLWSASVLYNSYHNYNSFVLNNFYGQKILYNDITIPFGFEDYKKLSENSYFYYKGKQAKISKFVWKVGRDTATVSFWVRDVYTKNLNETQLIP